MAGSLRDQLLKSGLVDEKKAKQLEKEKREASKQQHQQQKQAGKKNAPPTPAELARIEAQRIHAERAEKDREANRRKEEAKRKKALRAEMRQLVDSNRIERPKDGDVPFRFRDGDRLEKIYVTTSLQHQLARGQLAIVRMMRRYDLVQPDVAAKITERDPEGWAVGVINLSGNTEKPAEDDPYAQYQIPDDLTW